MSVPFPLPRAPQHCYSKWYNHTVESGTFKNYTILWVGSQLPCRFKSETINDNIGPHNVFILKKNKSFAYAVIDNTEHLYRLPKKFFTACFPGVQYNSIPTNNRIKIKITRNQTIEVPFIPQSFLMQKKQKTTRTKRKRSASIESTDTNIENIDFNRTYPSWHVLTNDQNKASPIKKEILCLIRHVLDYIDSNDSFRLESPFKDIHTLEDFKNNPNRMKNLKTCIAFIYHFCRSELGCNTLPPINSHDLQSWIGCLHNTATV